MRSLKRKNECPPDGFKYVHPETGHATVAFDPYNWVEKAKEHRRANGLPIPDDFEQQMEDQLCGTLPPELCEYQVGDPQWVNVRLDWRDVFAATRALVDTALGNFVSQDEAERRAKIC